MDSRLKLIDLDQPREGYRQFIGCWLYREAGLTFLVDPGPRSTVEQLIARLTLEGVNRVDYVLLTHIHLDHGGGCAEVLRAFPSARVYCHPSGVSHLQDPGRLWSGSLNTIGELAKMYQQPSPIAPNLFCSETELNQRQIVVVETPGHASHHVCFFVSGILFAGEAIATRIPLSGERSYLRPATPSRFFLDTAIQSMQKLQRLTPAPQWTAFGHYGIVEGLSDWCESARNQLLQWVEMAKSLMNEPNEDFFGKMFSLLMDEDPFFGQGLFEELDRDIQLRERFYVRNSLNGILEYLGSPFKISQALSKGIDS